MRSLFGFEIRIEETSLWNKENVKISKYQNNQLTWALNEEVELALLLTGSKKSWIYKLLFFIFSSGYFVDHDLNSWLGILPQCGSEIFFLIENPNF